MQKDKYTPIHNEVMEELMKINLSPYETRILFSILRKTYGFIEKNGNRKKTDWIAYSQITSMTGISKGHISRAIKGLILKKVIKREGRHIGFSKGFYREKLPVLVTNEVVEKLPVQVTPVTSSGNKKLPVQEPQKKLQKKLIQKKEHPRLFSLLLEQYPDKQGKSKAWERFNEQIRSKKDWYSISKALKNYKARLAANADWLKPQGCEVWFNGKSKVAGKGWRNFTEPYIDFKQSLENDKFKALIKKQKEGVHV